MCARFNILSIASPDATPQARLASESRDWLLLPTSAPAPVAAAHCLDQLQSGTGTHRPGPFAFRPVAGAGALRSGAGVKRRGAVGVGAGAGRGAGAGAGAGAR
ncbi:hypothetical protein B1218_34940 [Pseudomonas ogarae]|nr:hypothetical protein B1218_34940 [Pseudomonas ogarae]